MGIATVFSCEPAILEIQCFENNQMLSDMIEDS